MFGDPYSRNMLGTRPIILGVALHVTAQHVAGTREHHRDDVACSTCGICRGPRISKIIAGIERQRFDATMDELKHDRSRDPGGQPGHCSESAGAERAPAVSVNTSPSLAEIATGSPSVNANGSVCAIL